jgi:hypothetical protein
MNVRFTSFALSILLCSCASVPPAPKRVGDATRFQAIAAQFESTVVDVSDGISEVEAFKIAHGFFFSGEFVPCGVIGLPEDERDVWRVPLFEGYAGLHSRDVVVRKSDGAFQVESIRSLNLPNTNRLSVLYCRCEERSWIATARFARLAMTNRKSTGRLV